MLLFQFRKQIIGAWFGVSCVSSKTADQKLSRPGTDSSEIYQNINLLYKSGGLSPFCSLRELLSDFVSTNTTQIYKHMNKWNVTTTNKIQAI